MRQSNQTGFTLIELLLVIGLLTLSVGVTTDIVLNLVRSYNKTQITNEIEQNANFVYLKLERELRTAQSVSTPAVGVSATNLIFIDKDGNTIEYRVTSSRLERRVGTSGAYTKLTNDAANDPVGGLDISCFNNCFTKTSQNPDVIQIGLSFRQTGSPSSVSFNGSIDLSETIVVRGTY